MPPTLYVLPPDTYKIPVVLQRSYDRRMFHMVTCLASAPPAEDMASLRLALPLLAFICATQGFRISTVGGNHGLVPHGGGVTHVVGGGGHIRSGSPGVVVVENGGSVSILTPI